MVLHPVPRKVAASRHPDATLPADTIVLSLSMLPEIVGMSCSFLIALAHLLCAPNSIFQWLCVAAGTTEN
jgi:hypothetical protein